MTSEPEALAVIGEAERAFYKREMIAMGLPTIDGVPIMVMEFLVKFTKTLLAVKKDGEEFSSELKTAPNGLAFDSFRDGVFYRQLVIHEQRLGKKAMTEEVALEYDRLVARYGLPAGTIGRVQND